MKLVREYIINEKFTDESDPIQDLGIGLYARRNFKSENEMYEWLYKIVPILCNVNKCEEVIKNMEDIYDSPFLIPRYYYVIQKYCDDYLTLKNVHGRFYGSEFKKFVFKKNNLI